MATTTKRRPRKPGAAKDRKKRVARRSRRNGWPSAKTSDRYDLYERSVQEPEAECDLIDQVWRELRGRKCRVIREDFCGTAAVAMEWVRQRRTHRAIGVDLDPAVLRWARAKIPQRLTNEQAQRLRLVHGDVMTVRTERVDSVLAMNFSYFLFKTRPALRTYFARVRKALVPDGLFLLDAYGGSESFEEMEEDRDFDGFTYVWDQHRYDPVTGHAINRIHFEFPDGTKIRNAFEYDWRLWTLPEIQEVLVEAGFRDVAVYWEGTEKRTGEGNGVFKRVTEGDADAGWIAYIVASPR
jgi:SAM-dependent methyltransferase